MPSVSLNLLDPNLGIQNVMDSGSGARMPDARPLASTVLREAGLDELYQQGAAEKQLDAALCPPVGDGSILQPEIFQAELRGGLEALKDSRSRRCGPLCGMNSPRCWKTRNFSRPTRA